MRKKKAGNKYLPWRLNIIYWDLLFWALELETSIEYYHEIICNNRKRGFELNKFFFAVSDIVVVNGS